ncbi:MAG: zinc-ribbon domain-containing protein, partial [Candidatus Heimdallarchaeota archaeon]
DPGDYMIFNFEINEGARLYINYHAENFSSYEGADIIFSVMNDNYFELWVNAGNPEPEILNSTFYYEDAYVNINNLQVPREDTYYFVIYNSNSFVVDISVHVTIVPWGHIIAAGIMAVLLLFGATGIGIRVIHVTVYNAKQERRARGSNVEGLQVSEQPATNKKDGVFCQSCGSPLTPKDTRYCPQCGASV